ncbi:MAG: hypothetical protein K2G23_04835, partial [Muribaculaceae bacterium]|nr:hypothetical protein [Muribaculaceae bacterium]
MRRIGLKYISSLGSNFPAVNGGKWNLASNFYGDFNRILSETGVEQYDYETVSTFLRFIEDGMLICAARRQYIPNDTGSPYEALWMYISDEAELSPKDLASATLELSGIFDHPEAFTSVEAFEDILHGFFHLDFGRKEQDSSEKPEDEKGDKEETKQEGQKEIDSREDVVKDKKEKGRGKPARQKMSGSRIGYVGYDTLAELEIILSARFSPQYANFGLIFLTDYPVRVETSLPRIYLPELMLFQQMERERIRREEEELRRAEEEERRKEEERI